MNELVNYTPQEVFIIFQINQGIWSSLDEEVESSTIKKENSIFEWRSMNNLVGWSELYKIQNEIFDLSLSQDEWFEAVLPEKKRTVWELCEFIARHAKKEVVQPIKIFGKECLSASIFLTLKRDLSKRGLDVKDLRPSSSISLFTDWESFPKLVAEVSKRGISLSDSIGLKYKEGLTSLQKINIFNPDRFYIDTGATKTFRDLTVRILESQVRS